MPRLLAAAALTLCLAVPIRAADIPAEPSPAAETFVAQFSDDHLSGMLSKFGARQPALVQLSQVDGQLVALVLDAQIAEAVATHGPTWRRNMARVWTGLLDEQALTSLTEGGAASPFAARYQEVAPEAAQGMQQLSSEMFAQILQEVVDATVAELSAPAAQ